jgi:hypothetical protein
MSPVYVKNGTPVSAQSRCMSCSFAHIMRGFRESEEIVYCDYGSPMILVPFSVRDCTNHADKNRPSWEQMENLAIEVRPNPSFRSIGFGKREMDLDAEPETEVASK